MMKEKIVYRIFTIADYEREALYLEKMHGQGWKLRKATYSPFLVAVKYTFEKCQPQEVAYQMDFSPMKKSERESYLQLFRDYGWEHITDFNGFSYFCKPYSEIESESEFEIYNDAAGKLEMVHRILKLRLLPVLLLLAVLVPMFCKLFSGRNESSIFVLSLALLASCLLLLVLIQVSYISWKLFQKKKELSGK